MIQALLMHYNKRFPFSKFYDNLLNNITDLPNVHLKSNTFLKGYTSKAKVTDYIGPIFTKPGDIRVDLPVWFGDYKATEKIVIIGLEPRDSDKKRGILNIERVDNYVFATPFALERPKGPYYSAFNDLTNREDVFTYFTDIVKTYQVATGDKKKDDAIAIQNRRPKAQEEKPFLLEELEIIKPTKIIALGNDSFTFLREFLGYIYNIQKVRHPSQGGAKIARHQLSELVSL